MKYIGYSKGGERFMDRAINKNNKKEREADLYCTNCGSGQIKVEWWRDDKEDKWYIEIVCLNCGLNARLKLDVVNDKLDINEAFNDLIKRLERSGKCILTR